MPASNSKQPRCTVRGCPVRWVNGGADRPCADHADLHHTAAIEQARLELGIDLAQQPGFASTDVQQSQMIDLGDSR